MSVPTLWTVFVINFLALGLIWAYVIRSYPAFGAARFWAGSAFVGAGGAAVAMLHFALDSPVPLLIGGTMLILSACLAAMGIKRFYGQPVSWRASALIAGLSAAGMTFFVYGHDSLSMRILIYSLGQSAPLALTLKLLLSRQDGRDNPGARLAGIVTVGIICLYALRTVATVLHSGADFSIFQSNPLQWVLVLTLIFLSMSLNFGFLLMAMDRLRNEVGDAVDRLPQRQREAIACRYLRRMSIAETAVAMGCAQGTVKSAVSAALERLREVLEDRSEAH